MEDTRTRIFLVTVIIAVVLISFVLYRLFWTSSGTFQLSDPANDVVVGLGTQYLSMIDIVGASVERSETTLTVTVNANGAFGNLTGGGVAQWNVTVIVENDTDVLAAYEIGVKSDSTGLDGSMVNLETQVVWTCQVNSQENTLTIQAAMSQLQDAKKIEWTILSTYEKITDGTLVASASDQAPDEGLQETVF